MKTYLVLLLFALSACTTTEIGKPSVDPVLSQMAGVWGTVEATSQSCDKSPQTFTVSKDNALVTVRSKSKLYLGGDEGKDAVVYKVLAAAENSLTMSIEGEDRKTLNGAPVVWSLVFVNKDEFYWRQTDWPEGKGTASFMRCTNNQEQNVELSRLKEAFYDRCVAVEQKPIEESLKAENSASDPKKFVQEVCGFIALVCSDDPNGGPCRKLDRSYEEMMAKPGQSAAN